MMLNFRCFFIAVLFMLFSVRSFSQVPRTAYYKEQFAKIDSIAKIPQPKAALRLVLRIQQEARAEGDMPALLKTAVYRNMFQDYLEEDATNKIIVDLKQDILMAGQPAKSVLQSLLAETYWKFFQRQRYRIMQRSNASTLSEDVNTWSLEQITQAVVKGHLESIAEREMLQNTKVEFLDELLTGDRSTRNLRPTLYDLLAHRAIDVFLSTQIDLTSFRGNHSLIPDLRTEAQNIFEQLRAYHTLHKNSAALADVDLKQLKFLYEREDKKTGGYLKKLEQLALKYEHTEIYADILYEQALLYKNGKHNLEDVNLPLIKAVELAQEAIEAYPDAFAVKNLESLIKDIKRPELMFQANQSILSGKPSQLYLSSKNIDTVYVSLYRVPVNFENKGHYGKDEFNYFVNTNEVYKTWEMAVPTAKDYERHSFIDKMDALPFGNYVLIARNSPNADDSTQVNSLVMFKVSNMVVTSRQLNNRKHEYLVFDGLTGRSLDDVEVKESFHPNRFSKIGESGAIVKEALFIHKKDSLKVSGLYSYPQENNYRKVILFTDRPIYRPGQIIYYKGILFKDTHKTKGIHANSQLELSFDDVNGKEIEKLQVTTNSYGTFSGSFTIPRGNLNGRMQLHTKFGSLAVVVEEYKRPSFEIVFDAASQKYKLNDSISVQGKAVSYNGYFINGAEVKYRVVRSVFPHHYALFGRNSEQIASGTTQTNDQGNFNVSFFAADDHAGLQNYNYQIHTEITDPNGETRTAMKEIRAGKKDILLTVDIPQHLFLKEKTDSLSFKLQNLNGQPVKGKLQSTWLLLENPDRIIIPRRLSKPENYSLDKQDFRRLFPNDEYAGEANPLTWPVKKTAYQQELQVEAGDGQLMINDKLLKPGTYKLKFAAINSASDTVYREHIVRIYNEDPTTIHRAEEWLVAEKTSVAPGEAAVFRLSSPVDKGRVYYEVYQEDGIVSKVWLDVDPKQKMVKIMPPGGKNMDYAVQFTLVHNGHLYNSLENVTVLDPARHLDIKFLTFRDKLLPGEKESWKLRISNKAGEKQMAEMVASLYDASLDALQKMDWNKRMLHPYNYHTFNWRSTANELRWGNTVWFSKNNMGYRPLVGRSYEELNFKNYQVYLRSEGLSEVVVVGYGQGPIQIRGMSSALQGAVPGVQNKMVIDNESLTVADETKTRVNSDKVGSPIPPVVPRTNFNETAFFYPQLQTNENGEINIEFTIPQSLTRYKMMGFAHTKDLKTANITAELVTQKQLSIAAHAPRFVREGDSILWTARLQNLSGKNLEGIVSLEVRDALSGNIISILQSGTASAQSFNVSNQGNAVLAWPLIIPKGIAAITYKITAESGQYSDGEEITIPVLPNAMLVTESESVTLRGNSSKTIRLEKLLQSEQSATLQNKSLTLETTANPAWYGIQALPYLMEYPKECVEQTFSRFYANAFATKIINSSPKIKAVFQQWQQINNGQSLLSALEKNPELKNILLQESPWVKDAAGETEQKRRLALLFDLNQMSHALKDNFKDLVAAQTPDGAFPWFTGMQADRYITQHIVAGMGQLKRLNMVDDKVFPDFARVLKKAISYLDGELESDYRKSLDTTAAFNTVNADYLPLHYLYGRSYTNIVNERTIFERAMAAYLQKIVKNWKTMDPFQQGQAALVLHRSGNKAEALKVINLLKERAQYHEETGMYWTANRAGWRWYQNPVETQSLLIEAFTEIAGDTLAVAEMKIWLLTHKQTNHWKTTKATAAACYALLGNSNDLLSETLVPVVTLGNKSLTEIGISPTINEAGTGYQKFNLGASVLQPAMGEITISNPNSAVALASVHWQYLEQLDKITPAENGLMIKKQLFLKEHEGKGMAFKNVDGAVTLKSGDLVRVRMEITADRDMEYVHLKDMRAAGFEPVNIISSYKYQDGLSYYESTKDASTNFFISYLRKGVYVFEYELRASHAGHFSNGITTLQCFYAPEFSAHTEGIKVAIMPLNAQK